jgi:hypothetical protein
MMQRVPQRWTQSLPDLRVVRVRVVCACIVFIERRTKTKQLTKKIKSFACTVCLPGIRANA